MKLKILLDRVQTIYSKGVKSDDSRLTNRYIYSKLLTVRAKLIGQQYRKKQSVSQWNYQTLPCVELIKVPAHQCPCLPPAGCYSSELIQNVTSADRALKIDRVNINAVNTQKGNKYTTKKTNYFIQDGYLYITTPVNIKVVSLNGLFGDPIAANIFKGHCEDCVDCAKCFDYLDFDFPIDSDLIDVLIELTVAEIMGVFSQSIEDRTNNTRDSAVEQSK